MNNQVIHNAIIEGATLSIEDHGLLTSWLSVSYGSTGCLGQGFGGFALYLPKDFTHHTVQSAAGHFIFRVLQIADVGEWSRLKGKAIRIRKNAGRIEAIGHIVKDDWFCPSADFKKP